MRTGFCGLGWVLAFFFWLDLVWDYFWFVILEDAGTKDGERGIFNK